MELQHEAIIKQETSFTNCSKCSTKMICYKLILGKRLFFCPKCANYEMGHCNHVYKVVRVKSEKMADTVALHCTECLRNLNRFKKEMFNLNSLPQINQQEMEQKKEDLYEIYSDFRKYIYSLKCSFEETFEEMNEKRLEYYRSPEWKEKRNKIMQRDNYTCQVCGDKATDVHHLNYNNLFDEWDIELVALCRHCHKKYHGLI